MQEKADQRLKICSKQIVYSFMSRGSKETQNQSFMLKHAGKFDIFFKNLWTPLPNT